ncbi:MAG: hypothetical protein ACLQFW_19140 [Xanthobacteraceae bacterium]
MDWFGRQRRAAERARLEEERAQVQFALIQITARLNNLDAFALGLLKTLSQVERDKVLDTMRRLVAQMGKMPLPNYLPSELAPDFRNELSRVMQLFIETASKKA